MRTENILNMNGLIEALIDHADKTEDALELKFSEMENGKLSGYRNALQGLVLVDLNESNIMNHMILSLAKEVSKREALIQTDWSNLHPDFVLGEIMGYRTVLETMISFRDKADQLAKQQHLQLEKEAAEWEKFMEKNGFKK